MKKTNETKASVFSEDELALIRAQNAEYQRNFWAKMSPEERKQRKALYVLHTAQNKLKKAQEQSNA